MRFLATTIACLIALVATASVAAAAPADFAISYQRSGGLAASTSRLVVRPGLRAVAETSGSRAGQRRAGFRIGRGRVEALERGLRRASFGSLEFSEPSSCADCFEYEIAYRGHRVSFNESETPPKLSEVLGELESIVTAHAIPPNA